MVNVDAKSNYEHLRIDKALVMLTTTTTTTAFVAIEEPFPTQKRRLYYKIAYNLRLKLQV